MASVAFEHLTKRYPNGVVGVDDVSLDVADGELLVLVGPSGCGKSTLLRLLAGLESPTAGHVRIDGRIVDDLAPQARNIAMVFQDYALYPFMTVRRNLAFPLAMRRLPRATIAERVAWVAGLLDLDALLDRYPRQLSGGQRQRVAMGRALVREPSVSLLDEPLSNLDARLRVEVRAQIAALQQRTHTTMVYVTHDQTEAMTLGQRIAVLERGRLQQVAPPRVLYDTPANRFVAGFIGSPPMNLLPARLVRDGAQLQLALAGTTLQLPAGGAAAAVDPARVRHAGLRPEALRLAAADAGTAALPARLEHVEYLGHETLLHAVADDSPITARVPGMQRLAPGDTLHLAFDPAALHLFDEGGAALR